MTWFYNFNQDSTFNKEMSSLAHSGSLQAELRTRLLKKNIGTVQTTPNVFSDAAVHDSPVQKGLAILRKRLENKWDDKTPGDEKTSPMLVKLRETPGRPIMEKQQILIQKHEDVKEQADRLNIGGGITLWPQMDSMRLSRKDLLRLFTICCLLLITTLIIFKKVHGTLLLKLWRYQEKLAEFHQMQNLEIDSNQEEFSTSVLNWHKGLRGLLTEVDGEFNISTLSLTYSMYIVVYLSAVSILLFYLIDNMVAKSKLSPRRIKRWVCLLTLTGCWTASMAYTLMCAQRIECQIEAIVIKYNEYLGELVTLPLDLSQYNSVLSYWKVRCLPPTAEGLLKILGVVRVRDVTFYLLYYSVPIVTALCMPIIKLFMSLHELYSVKDSNKIQRRSR